ncbi:phage tail tape measure protein [Bacillus sp. UMB0728]|uniref:phage tail tape measure protein n=1 Tax=Bacillus sp. UMB0728 TaxID=2066052 RepID=UPI0015DF9415|nr:phage tail tape measure protein [Bacillus sp. UMB0728]
MSTALMKSAGAAQTYGVSLENTLGFATAIGQVTRESGSIIGNSLKSIYSRITSIQPAIDSLAAIGINIKTSSGDMRDVQNILTDLAGQWKSLSKEQQQNLGLQIAGKKNYLPA